MSDSELLFSAVNGKWRVISCTAILNKGLGLSPRIQKGSGNVSNINEQKVIICKSLSQKPHRNVDLSHGTVAGHQASVSYVRGRF